MAITLNTGFLKTVNGIFKIVEFVLVLIVLLIARFGREGDPISWGSTHNYTFLGIGTTVGFAIIVPAIVLTYLLGATPSVLEFIINLIGGILFISMGSTLVEYGNIQLVVGVLAIAVGIVFLADFVYLCVTTRFTVIHTTRT